MKIRTSTKVASIIGGILAVSLALTATYDYFSPGGSLSGTWNSQTTNVGSGGFIIGDLPYANIVQGSALSVLGVTGNATADLASISAGTDNNVLRRSGTTLDFGAINLASSDAVSGILLAANGGTSNGFFAVSGPATSTKTFTFPNASAAVLTDNAAVTLAQGGTGLTSAADDTTLISSGAAWVASAIPDCTDTGGNHLNYTAGSNTISCGTSGGGVAQTTSTFTVTWPTACTTTPSQGWAYTKTGNTITLRLVDNVSCTSDSASFVSAAGDVPAAIRPANTVILLGALVTDNGVGQLAPACIQITSAGTMTVRRSVTSLCDNAGFTATGTKELNNAGFNGPNSFSYTLD